MMISMAVMLWCVTLIHSMVVVTSASVMTSIEQTSRNHRITQKDGYKKPRLPVPVIFDTDYGPFIDDGMFTSNLTLLLHFCNI